MIEGKVPLRVQIKRLCTEGIREEPELILWHRGDRVNERNSKMSRALGAEEELVALLPLAGRETGDEQRTLVDPKFWNLQDLFLPTMSGPRMGRNRRYVTLHHEGKFGYKAGFLAERERFCEERDEIIKEGRLSRWLKQHEAGETLIQHLLWPRCYILGSPATR